MNQTCWPLTVHEVPYFSLESFRVGITSHVCKSLSRRPSHPKRMVSFFRWYNYSASEFHFQQWQRFHVSPTHWGSSPDSRAWRATTEHINLAFPRAFAHLRAELPVLPKAWVKQTWSSKRAKGRPWETPRSVVCLPASREVELHQPSAVSIHLGTASAPKHVTASCLSSLPKQKYQNIASLNSGFCTQCLISLMPGNNQLAKTCYSRGKKR